MISTASRRKGITRSSPPMSRRLAIATGEAMIDGLYWAILVFCQLGGRLSAPLSVSDRLDE